MNSAPAPAPAPAPPPAPAREFEVTGPSRGDPGSGLGSPGDLSHITLLSLDSGITVLDRPVEPPASAPEFQVTGVPGTTNDRDHLFLGLD